MDSTSENEMRNDVKNLVSELNKLREDYYNGNGSDIVDEEFDFKEKRLKELDPSNPYFDQVGAKTQTRDIPVEHEYPMLSMQKEQTAEAVVDWFFDIVKKFPYLVFEGGIPSMWYEPKFDGISGTIVYDKNGNYRLAATRGDGTVGALIPFGNKIEGVLGKYVPNSELRGEFIIPKRYSKNINGPLRNNCSGIIKRKDETEDIKYIHFVTYDVRYHEDNENSKFKNRLDKLLKIKETAKKLNGKEPIMILPMKTVNVPEVYENYIHKLRDEWGYETDGIILTIDGDQNNYDLINSKYKITTCNRYNMALKPPALMAGSKVKDIEVYTNRMKLSFVAIINPITLGDVHVNRATLNNYTDMKEKKIGIGSTVLVKRSNDVIPKIVESYNKTGDEIKFVNITKCPSCGSPVVLYNRDLVCTNEYGCVGIYESKLSYLLTNFGVKNIGPSTIHKLVELMKRDNRIFTYSEFIKMHLNNEIDNYLSEIFGDGLRKSIYLDSFKHFFDSVNEIGFLGSMNIPLIGESQLIKLGIKSFDDFKNYCEKITENDTIISGIDSILFKWYNDEKYHDIRMKELSDCEKMLKPYFKKSDKIIPDDAITYCISGETPGFKDKNEVKEKLKSLNPNLRFVDNVKVGLDYLISNETGTSKVMKARKYNIPVLTIDEMINRFS